MNGYVIRTEAFFVAVIIPDLRHQYIGLFIFAGVRDGILEFSIAYLLDYRLAVARYLRLGNRIDNLITVVKLGQSAPGAGPVIFFIQFSTVNNLAALQQLNCYAVRTETLLIIGIIPDLLNGYFCLLSNMSIGQSRESSVRTIVGHRITGRHNFRPGIFDIFSVCLCIQFSNRICPVIAVAECNALAGIHAVCQQFYGYTARTNTILVVSVVPDLLYAYFGFLRFMRIGQCVAEVAVIIFFKRHFSLVAFRNSFFHLIIDRFSILVLIQAAPAVAPAITLVECYGGSDCCSVCCKLYAQIIRPDSVLISLVFPFLLNRNVNLVCIMAVGNSIAEVAIRILRECDTIGIALRHRRFFCAVSNQIAIPVFVKSGPLIAPAIASVECHRSTEILAVCFQLNSYTVRLDTILVLPVNPDLFDRYLNFLSLVAVFDGIAEVSFIILCKGNFFRISRYSGFFNSIGDNRTVAVFVQISPFVFPAVGAVQRYRIAHITAILLQLDSHALRLLAILVMLVIPDFLNRNLNLFSYMRVGKSCEKSIFGSGTVA